MDTRSWKKATDPEAIHFLQRDFQCSRACTHLLVQHDSTAKTNCFGIDFRLLFLVSLGKITYMQFTGKNIKQ